MKKKNTERMVSIVLWMIMVILGADIVIKGLKLDEETWGQMMRKVQQQTMETYLPGVVEEQEGETAVTWLLRRIGEQIPVSASRDKRAGDALWKIEKLVEK